ncbi:hypothetical protein [Tissierella sp.]|uniref:hypothetical protein n=1 Tax=Tissierella sp. TaxID=41274 RepID=UPI0028A61C07|nr:hypothetical protein [Tissierella sp.]
MIKLLRQHLFKNVNLISMLDKNDSIFYIDKPEKRDDKTYIVIKDKLLSGQYIEEYQLTFHIVSPTPQKVKDTEREVIDYLNDPRGEKIIKNDDTFIRNIQVLNGGGTIRTPENDYLSVVYFIVRK